MHTNSRSLRLFRQWTPLCLGVLTLALVLVGCDSDGSGMDEMDNPTIAELASNTEDLSTLTSALQQAGLDQTLNDEESTFTVFAPTNNAFQDIDADELTADADLLEEVLTFHVVAGQELTADDIEDGQTVETVGGETLTFSVDGGTVQVNGASVTMADREASNGIVHVIDGVLLETVDAVDRARLTPALSTTATAIEAAGLDGSDSPLRTETLTLFAPADGAFEGLDLDALTSNTELLGRILNYHAIPGQRLTSDQISSGQSPPTREGGTIEIQVADDGTVTLNGIPVSTTDIQTENAVIHVIDGVLLQRIDVVERATITSSLSTLASAVQAAGLDASDSPLRNEDPVTVFAPPNSAFDPLDVDELTDDTNILNRVLPYHAIGGQALFADDLSSGDVQTLEGGDVAVEVGEDGVTVNGVPVTTTDIETRNGVVHLIDGVLLRRLDIVQRATVTSTLSTLADGVAQAGLANALKGDGPFTVFAPVDSAFEMYDVNDLTGTQELLERVLTYHAIPGQQLEAGDLSEGESPETVEGGTITISLDDGVTLNGRAEVTVADIPVRNGVVHLIDNVLLRRTNVVQRATVTPGFDILVELVGQAGLASDLSNEDAALTVFAPTDDAFLAALDANDNGEIDEDEVPSNAEDLLTYHVGDGVFWAADEPTAPSGQQIPEGQTGVSTLEGSNVLVDRAGSDVTLNPDAEAASVAVPDVDVTNGVIHGIDTVLQIPSN